MKLQSETQCRRFPTVIAAQIQAWSTPLLVALLCALGVESLLSLLPAPADARGGGGHAFSGASHPSSGGGHSSFGSGSSGFHSTGIGHTYSSGGGGGGGMAFLIFLVIIIVVAIVIYQNFRKMQQGGGVVISDGTGMGGSAAPETRPDIPDRIRRLRDYDANFSEIAFTDFIYTLYGRAHEARGRGELETLSPYLSSAAIASLVPVPPAIRDVKGVIVGGAAIVGITDPAASDEVNITVRYEGNYTEVNPIGKEDSYYAVEIWTFNRKRDVLSPAPEQITALHCPKCGGALDFKSDGSCAYCGVKITGGDFAWYVTSIQVEEREDRGPLLTTDVPEEGNELATIYQPGLQQEWQQFTAQNPDFDWQRTASRFQHIFNAIQDAWSSLAWDKVRPFETDNIFSMHRYWIEAYRRQGLRNALEQVQIQNMIPVKIQSDLYYDAITTRIYASMVDYTVDGSGHVVCGSRTRARPFTEYWTFIRRRGAAENQHDPQNCPNCGAPLKINMAGSCEFCGGKVASGAFDWVLSRIEQDEAYVG